MLKNLKGHMTQIQHGGRRRKNVNYEVKEKTQSETDVAPWCYEGTGLRLDGGDGANKTYEINQHIIVTHFIYRQYFKIWTSRRKMKRSCNSRIG